MSENLRLQKNLERMNINHIHYALSDFRTADGTRKGEDYMKNYFISKYGAIKDVDFSDILDSIVNESEGTKNA